MKLLITVCKLSLCKLKGQVRGGIGEDWATFLYIRAYYSVLDAKQETAGNSRNVTSPRIVLLPAAGLSVISNIRQRSVRPWSRFKPREKKTDAAMRSVHLDEPFYFFGLHKYLRNLLGVVVTCTKLWRKKENSFYLFLPPANEVWGKVMFLHFYTYVSFCSQGGLASQHASQVTWPGGLHLGCLHPRGVGRSPRYYGIRSTIGKYVSYWNAFLFFREISFWNSILIPNLNQNLTLSPTLEFWSPRHSFACRQLC